MRRQPGSAFKTFAYLAAIASKRATTATLLLDSPVKAAIVLLKSNLVRARKAWNDIAAFVNIPPLVQQAEALVMAMPLVTAGDPDRSFMLKRLIDPAYGELMPRQCRTWNDAANLALACWIAGLAPDASNAFAPPYDSKSAVLLQPEARGIFRERSAL